MAACSSTKHMYVYEDDDLHKLEEHTGWVEESVNVFMGTFTCNSDKEKLVDVVMALYSFCVVDGREAAGEMAGEMAGETRDLSELSVVEKHVESAVFRGHYGILRG